jgi:hypothetical protein
MGLTYEIRLRTGRELKLTEEEAAELFVSLEKYASIFRALLPSERTKGTTKGRLTDSPKKPRPTLTHVLDYIRRRPNYQHTLRELEMEFYGRSLGSHGPFASEWTRLFMLAHDARKLLSEKEGIKWERKREPGESGRLFSVYRKA